jgi:hypothetical protein
VLAGNAVVSGTTIAGAVMLSVTGTTEQTGSITVGAAAGDSANLGVQAGATYDMQGGFAIDSAAPGAVLDNAGEFLRTGAAGLAEIDVKVINTGMILGQNSEMQFLQTVSGTGTVQIDPGALVGFDNTVTPGQTVAFAGSDGVLRLDGTPNDFGATIANFNGGDEIELALFNPTLAHMAFDTSTNILTVADGTNIAHLHFAAGLAASDFSLGFAEAGVGIFHT